MCESSCSHFEIHARDMVPWLTRPSGSLDPSIQKMSGVARRQQPAARKKMHATKRAAATGSAYQKLEKKSMTGTSNLKCAPANIQKSLIRSGNARRACSSDSIAVGIPRGPNAKQHLMGGSATARIRNMSGVGAVDRRCSAQPAVIARGDAGWRNLRCMQRLRNQRLPKKTMPPAVSGATSAAAKDVDLLVGPVCETDAQHIARHAGLRVKCIRCVEIKHREQIRCIAPWASARPTHLGGSWRMGCRICAVGRKNAAVLANRAAHIAANKKKGVCKQAISRASRWAFFQFINQRSTSISRLNNALKYHAASDFHRTAMGVIAERPTSYMVARHLDAPTTVNANRWSPVVAPCSMTFNLTSRRVAAPVQPAAPRAGQLVAPKAIDSLDAVAGHIHDPFRGRSVPQRQEWMDVWADSTSYVSIRKHESLKEKRGELKKATSGLRKRHRAMIRIAAEVVRADVRKTLREATSITLAVDECDTRKVLRVRCDTPEPPYQWDGAICICKKLFGITGDISRELKDDYAVQNRRLFEQTLESFYMPLKPHVKRKYARRLAAGISGCAVPASGESASEIHAASSALSSHAASGAARLAKKRKGISNARAACNTDDLSDFVKKVRVLASDGGKSERRAVFCIAHLYFPNVQFVIEDPAHGLRIALTKPLQLVDDFKEIQEALYKNEHSLIPDIQNSGKWKEVLRGISKTAMRIPNLQRDGALNVVLHHLAYAKVRMDSTADPIAKLCLMLMPIAFLLSFIASDERNTLAQRTRASDVLAKFQPKFCIGAGVTADWGLITVAFLRLFDRLNHDISNSADEMDDFSAQLTHVSYMAAFFVRFLCCHHQVAPVSQRRLNSSQSAFANKLQRDAFSIVGIEIKSSGGKSKNTR